MNGFRRRLMAGFQTSKLTTIRIDQNLTDPATMITRIVDEGGIEAIRANSHRYVGVFDSTANLMSLRQLGDNDGTKYLDGTDAPITTLGNDVWMKLPQFWYKAEEYDTDVWDITFAYGSKPDGTFKEWDGKDLIGVYKASNLDGKLYSLSNTYLAGSLTQSNFKTRARNRGNGFTLVKWKCHCMIAMLFYAYYCNTDSQAICGSGSSNREQSGPTDYLGMKDTTGEPNIVNFWGLEHWWGTAYEFIDNVEINNGIWNITEDDNTIRTETNGNVSNGLIGKMLFGENMDLMPISNGLRDQSFCDSYYSHGTNPTVLARSCNSSDFRAGVSFIAADFTQSLTASSYGTRLSYRGDYIITD